MQRAFGELVALWPFGGERLKVRCRSSARVRAARGVTVEGTAADSCAAARKSPSGRWRSIANASNGRTPDLQGSRREQPESAKSGHWALPRYRLIPKPQQTQPSAESTSGDSLEDFARRRAKTRFVVRAKSPSAKDLREPRRQAASSASPQFSSAAHPRRIPSPDCRAMPAKLHGARSRLWAVLPRPGTSSRPQRWRRYPIGPFMSSDFLLSLYFEFLSRV